MARRKAATSRRFNDQRYMHRSVIDKKAMFALAMFAERFSVIAHSDDQSVIVKIEAARQAPHSIQHIRAHDRAGRIPIFLESLRDRAELRIERLSSEILNSVLKRISAGEDCGVRRPRQRHLRNCAVKDCSIM